jgi:multiple sugar transport system substrate-binding protein
VSPTRSKGLRSKTLTVTAVTAFALLVAACSGGSSSTSAKQPVPSGEATGTVEFWHFFTDREAKAFQSVVDDFQASHPKIKVVVKSGQDDTKATQAISAGKGPDLDLSYSTDITGKFCSSGAFRDLSGYISRDKIDMSQFPQTVKNYTEFNGKRCAMPLLSDTYGLYYNKTLLAKAGYTAPPKTMTELAAMAKKLTQRNADGTIKVAGFVPTVGFYENAPAHYAPQYGAKWLTGDGQSAIGSDPTWQSWLQSVKSLTDWYGSAHLTKFTAGAGQEYSADNAFETGKIAMAMDGEYRTAFIQSEHPELKFGTAPFPTADDKTSLYGAGYVTGNIIGITKGAKNPNAAWELLKYLTTDTNALVKLGNGVKNIPTTLPALHSPNLQVSANYKTFVDVFANPNSATTPASPNGGAYQNTFQDFVIKYQDGKVSDLAAGLKGVDSQIDAALKLGQAP